MFRVLVTEFMDENCLNRIQENFNLKYDLECLSNKNKLIDLIKDVDAIIVRNKTQLTKEILSYANKLKFVGRLGVGLDNIDTVYCNENDIHVHCYGYER